MIKTAKKIVSLVLVPYYLELYKDLKSNMTVLDVGCGKNSCLNHLPLKLKKTGIEIYKPDYLKALKNGEYQKIYNEDNKKIMDLLIKKNKTFDVVLLSDIIEHYKKKEAIKIIKLAEKLGKKIIIFTPLGFMKQNQEENPYQEHKSGWKLEEFDKLGYNSKILRNFKIKSIYAKKIN